MNLSAQKLRNISIASQVIAAKSLDFKWKGPLAHLAPTEATPLAKSLLGKTNCGLYVLLCGSLIWAARRMEQISDTLPLLQIAEALLCFQDDPLYFAKNSPSHLQSKLPIEREVIETLCTETTAIFMETPGRHPSRPPVQAVENVLSITKFVLGPVWRNPFQEWVQESISKLDVIAPNSHQLFRSRYDFTSVQEWNAYKKLNMGPPLPLDILTTVELPVKNNLNQLYATFLQGVDSKTNPYLATPEAMIDLGFIGTPYNVKEQNFS